MKNYFQKSTSAAPLAVFRILFGLLIFGSIIRFWSKGWIYDLYLKPKYFFSFYGFEFVKPLHEYTYIVFAICAVSALLVALGLFYRVASIFLFISFTYIELMDKSTYLNHYYFVSMISLMMIFLPAHVYFSIDSFRRSRLKADAVPQWNIDALKLFVCIVYVFAGLAKVNSDWLLEAQPLRMWLPAKNDVPLIGPAFNYLWVAYAFSWAGCLYDLSIPFLLLSKSTRYAGFIAVVVFHILTAILFPIGMFPYIMIATALIFFSGEFHQRIIKKMSSWLRVSHEFLQAGQCYKYSRRGSLIVVPAFCIFFLIQLVLPFRYWLYPGELFWTEEGYRFSWRVMLMEKAGHAQFRVKDSDGRQVAVDNTFFLTPLQEKMMSTQPDMILQYAHILREHYSKEGFQSPEVYVDSYVVLNGRLGKPLIDPLIDLTKQEDSFGHKPWVLTFNDEIKGL
ncbi:MAG TPA: HTTM domain-containing protein [Chryseolinea sp.]|nr:HTTM domain-containing protein [Chryseolinea sp.]